MKVLLETIQGAPIYLYRDAGTDDERVTFTADMDVDCDGSGGNPDGDPYFQPDTTLHHDGKALDAYKVPFVVVPPVVCRKTRGRVLGARCVVTNTRSGKQAVAVVGDIGPTRKIGEGSPRLCELLGLDPNANHGGTSDFVIRYEIEVETPAIIDGVRYSLQHYGA